jgi:hypothetical protein
MIVLHNIRYWVRVELVDWQIQIFVRGLVTTEPRFLSTYG